jgi:hypothetical protein
MANDEKNGPVKQSASVGGEMMRSGGGWSPRDDGWDQSRAAVPAAAPAAAPAEVEDGAVESARAAVRQNIMSVEEAAQHYRLTDDEVEAIGKPAQPTRSTLKAVEAELKKIGDMRRTDSRAYWKDEAVQIRERALIGELEKLKAGAPVANENEAEGDEAGGLVAGDGSGLPDDLLKAWDAQGGREFHLKHAQDTVRTMIDGLDDGEQAAFIEGFDNLPAGAVRSIYEHLAIDPGGSVREASAGEMETFAAHGDACSEVVKAWGRNAAQKYATAAARVDLMLGSMSEADAAKAEAWFRKLPAAQKASVVKALAG